ncbi:MAG: RHS repeat-associated core domain-containing protein, partial [Acidobacteria bacterium]|nr:RHS repeat-associated core domain-containing protein [Acidobacteriota bacterium]
TYGLDLISQRSNTAVSFYNYDGHGSVRGLSSTDGSLTDTYSYDAFGTIIERTGTTDNNYLYAGEQFDADLGFYYNRARYLNVETGRFLSQDSYEGSQFEPKSLHKYVYADNDPANRTDPSGRYSIAETTIVINVNSILSTMSSILAAAAVLSVACALDAGGSILLDTPALGSCGKNNENRVYRGTETSLEIQAFQEAGHILSEEARTTYAQTGSLTAGYAKAAATHQVWNSIWGNELFHEQAHGIFGLEMGRSFGMNRTFVSVTKNINIAHFFAGSDGRKFTANIPRWEMVPQTYKGAGEGEWLISDMV